MNLWSSDLTPQLHSRVLLLFYLTANILEHPVSDFRFCTSTKKQTLFRHLTKEKILLEINQRFSCHRNYIQCLM